MSLVVIGVCAASVAWGAERPANSLEPTPLNEPDANSIGVVDETLLSSMACSFVPFSE
jgi:hypothetical protein